MIAVEAKQTKNKKPTSGFLAWHLESGTDPQWILQNPWSQMCFKLIVFWKLEGWYGLHTNLTVYPREGLGQYYVIKLSTTSSAGHIPPRDHSFLTVHSVRFCGKWVQVLLTNELPKPFLIFRDILVLEQWIRNGKCMVLILINKIYEVK